MTALRERAIAVADAKPSLPRHVRLQFDPVRQAWAVLSPERIFWPNEISLDILRLCDGRRTIATIAGELVAEYNAPPEEVERDVTEFLQEWSDRKLVRL
jgi:pyrroloquinoline quinone biosynthesis protein D